MRDLDLISLRLFVSVCETRNMARAGEQANLVGSAISKRLALLEESVGATLLVRRRHGVDPTPAGETLLEHARAMLERSQRIERDMAAFAAGIKGQVRVLATTSAMAESLADDVAAFLRQPAHADIRVDLEEAVSREVVRGLSQGSASLGICWDSPHSVDLSALKTQPYRPDHLAVVVHPAHPLAHRAQLHFAETLDYEHVSLPVASAVQVMLQRAAAALGKTMVQRVVVSNFETALRVVRAQLAICIMPREVAQVYTAAHDLRIIALQEEWARRQFSICCVDVQKLSPAATLLRNHLASAPG